MPSKVALSIVVCCCVLVGGGHQTVAREGDCSAYEVAVVNDTKTNHAVTVTPDYRDALRSSVRTLSEYARSRNPDFIIITRNGLGLVVKSEREARIDQLTFQSGSGNALTTGESAGSINRHYARLLDGVVIEGQYCGDPTASAAFIEFLQGNGLTILSLDHCGSAGAAAAAWRQGRAAKVIAHADSGTGPLMEAPVSPPLTENANNVLKLADAHNLLVLDATQGYGGGQGGKDRWLTELQNNNYDILAIDPFYLNIIPLEIADVRGLKHKKLGAKRLVLARINLSRALDTAYYWKAHWENEPPEWAVAAASEAQPGAYDVKFWNGDWRSILGRTFSGIMDLGFDGALIEGVEAYRPLEAKEDTPL